EADWPPDDEAEDGHRDPAGVPGALKHMRTIVLFRRAAPSIDICGVGHFPLHDGDHAVVNVNNIYIPKPSRVFVKRAARRTFEKIIWGFPRGLRVRRRRVAPAADPAVLIPAGGQSGSRGRADRSALRLPAVLPATSAACAAPHRRGRTARPRRATATRYAAPSSSPAAAACRAAPSPQDVRRQRG